MSNLLQDRMLQAKLGNSPGEWLEHKFGLNLDIDTATEDVHTLGGAIHWPTTGKTIRVKAGGDANDDAAGSGIQSVLAIGIESGTGALISESMATNGVLASAATTKVFWRVFRLVGLGGTYHGVAADNVIVETSDGADDLIEIPVGKGQSQSSAFTVPANHTAFLTCFHLSADNNKTSTPTMWHVPDGDIVAAPFPQAKALYELVGLSETFEAQTLSMHIFGEYSDIWWAAPTTANNTAVWANYCLWVLPTANLGSDFDAGTP